MSLANGINEQESFKSDGKQDMTFNQFLFLTLPPRQRHFSFPPETGKVCGEADILEWRRTRTEALGERAPPDRPLVAWRAGRHHPLPMAWLYPQVLAGKRQLFPAEEISNFAHCSQRLLINLLHTRVHVCGAMSKLESAGPLRTFSPPCHIFCHVRSP